MALVTNKARQRLAEGGLAIGFGVHHLRGPAAGMLAAAADFDWLFIDMEHGAMSLDDAAAISLAALGQGIAPIARVCKDALHEAARALDNGALGIVVPHVDSAEEAQAVVRALRYPPEGARSWGGPPPAYRYRAAPPAEAQRALNAEVLICCMIETEAAVANAAAIAAVPGVDALMIGTSDLTATMGIAGEIGHPRVRAAYAAVAEACLHHQKVLGMGGVYDEAVAGDYVALGVRLILGGSDHAFLMAGAGNRARFLRGLEAG
jgi:2-keto-3-deoxy-L-rhamnonate aldolase RhmA